MFGLTKLPAILGIVALSLSGCVDNFAPEDPSLLSSEEQSIRAIERQRTQTAVAVGAGAGALIGLVATRNQSREDQFKGILIGGLLGAAAGFATGEYVNTRTRSFSSDQQALQSLITAADRDIANYRSLNNTSSRLITQQRAKVRQLNGRLSSGAVSAESYRTQVASAANNIRSLDKGVSDIDKQIAVMKTDRDNIQAAGKSAGGLSSRISRLEAEKRTLESRRRSLASVYDEVPDAVGAYDF